MSNFLYTSYRGQPVNHLSYSSGSMFSDCATKWQYKKKLGWIESNKNAAPELGKCFEDAIQFYHESGYNLDRTIQEFKIKWLAWKENKEIRYKDRESWELMSDQAIELLKLYSVKLPTFPITNPRFQLKYTKELFPGDETYSGIEDMGYVDMQVDHPPKNHPLLPKPLHPENGQPIIIDIKTSGKSYPANPKLLRLDPQLRRYSWESGIETVAFMVFVRGSLNLERGDNVTVLKKTGNFVPTQKAAVFDTEENTVYIMSYPDFSAYKEESKGVLGNALKAIKSEYMAWRTTPIPREDVAAQDIQFLATIITDEDRRQAGEQAGRELVEIHRSDRENFFPQNPGVRFPAQRCLYCSHLGLCIDDKNLVEQKLINISNLNVPEKDWLDEEE